jgi:hypothetical protein
MAGTIVFLAVSIFALNIIAVIIHKRMNRIEIYATIMFAVLFEIVVDIILDLKLNLYTYFGKGLDLSTFIVIFGIYPASNVIILNYFPYSRNIIQKIIYILIVSICCIIFEWLSVKSGYFHYMRWKFYYSALCYPPIISILA